MRQAPLGHHVARKPKAICGIHSNGISDEPQMTNVTYRKITPLTDNEITAARAYTTESGLFHLACQADHGMTLDAFQPYQEFLCSGKLAALKSATSSKYELTSDATVYSGHGNGTAVVGALGHNDLGRFLGLKWQYRGFTSTSSCKEKAEDFVHTREKSPLDTPVVLEFCLPAGFRLLPMAILGSHEAEFLISPNCPFKIVTASRITVRSVQNVLHLVLRLSEHC
jgi:hypothetical protein